MIIDWFRQRYRRTVRDYSDGGVIGVWVGITLITVSATADYIVRMTADDTTVMMPADNHTVQMPADNLVVTMSADDYTVRIPADDTTGEF